MGHLLRLFLVLAIALAATAAVAATKKKPAPAPEKPKASYELPMTVAIVRSDAPGCEPLCPEWIAAEGEITMATPGLFRKALKAAGKKKLPVIINSPGGQMAAALEIGRTIRKAKLDVAVGWTLYGGCKPTDKSCKLSKEQKGVYRGTVFAGRGFCNSACPLLLASGTQRLSGIWTYVGVHQVRTTWYRERVTYREKYRIVNGKKKVIDRKIVSRKPFKSYQKDGIDKRLRKNLATYFAEMGVSLDAIEDMNRAPFTSIYQLTTARQLQLKLVTSWSDATSLTSPAACRMAVAAANCIKGNVPATAKSTTASAANPKMETPAESSDSRLPPGPPMVVATVRSSAAGCEPLCAQWISAAGVITAWTPNLLRDLLKRRGTSKMPIVIDSPGGDFDAALEIGRMIREYNLDAIVAHTRFDGCWPNKPGCYGWYAHTPVLGNISGAGHCDGACVFVFAAGRTRLAIHKSSFTVLNPDYYASKGHWQPAASQIYAYLGNMGIDTGLLQFMHALRPGERVELSESHARRFKIATDFRNTKSFDHAKACLAADTGLVCVKR